MHNHTTTRGAVSAAAPRWSEQDEMAHIEEDIRTGELKIAMKLKVKTPVSLTEHQQNTLQRLGCEAKPFITWPHTLIFAATVTAEQEQELRNLEYVTEVEPMPTYGFK